jgi:hypothetical protein
MFVGYSVHTMTTRLIAVVEDNSTSSAEDGAVSDTHTRTLSLSVCPSVCDVCAQKNGV